MNAFFRKAVLRMRAYAPGEQPRPGEKVVKLNTNENPYPPAKALQKALKRFDPSGLNRYPDPEATALRTRLARVYRRPKEEILVGNGSDELLALLFRACVEKGDEVQILDLTYSLYPVLAAEREAEVREVPLREDFSVPWSDFSRKVRLTVLAHPNPPVGVPLEKKAFLKFVEESQGLVVVDEAYAPFASFSFASDSRRRSNLVVVQTASKAYALAGLRVGWLFASPSVIQQLRKIKDSYNVDSLAQHLARAALSPAALRETKYRIKRIRAERGKLREELTKRGFFLPASEANFLLAFLPEGRKALPLQKALKKHGVLVRYFHHPRLANALRITVGRPEENMQLLRVLDKILESGKVKR